MPYYMPTRRRRVYRKKRTYRRKGAPSYNLKGITSMRPTRAEEHYIDIASMTYNCDTTGALVHLSVISVGTSITQRMGKQTMITGLRIQGFMEVFSTMIYNPACVSLVWDLQLNKALSALTLIYISANSQSLPVRENADRFKILREWNILQEASTEKGNIQFIKNIRFPKGLIAFYASTDTAGGIGSCISGALYIVTRGGFAGTAASRLNCTMRLEFDK